MTSHGSYLTSQGSVLGEEDVDDLPLPADELDGLLDVLLGVHHADQTAPKTFIKK